MFIKPWRKKLLPVKGWEQQQMNPVVKTQPLSSFGNLAAPFIFRGLLVKAQGQNEPATDTSQ